MKWQEEHRRRGFTLVELLVVVGIISVIIAFLLPALQTARRRAVQLACMSNLRQQGLAIMMYVNDNRGALPNGDLTDGNYNYSHAFEANATTLLVDVYSKNG